MSYYHDLHWCGIYAAEADERIERLAEIIGQAAARDRAAVRVVQRLDRMRTALATVAMYAEAAIAEGE